jgi:copper chaperone
MAKVTIKVEGMSCEHCVRAIHDATGQLPSVGGVVVDLEAKTVTLDHDPEQTPLEKIKFEIEEAGYEVIE